MKKSNRWSFMLIVFILLSSFARGTAQESTPGVDYLKLARDLARQVILVDTHIDVPYRLHKKWEDISQRTPDGHFDYPRARAGGLDVVFMAIFTPPELEQKGGSKALADSLLDLVEEIVRRWPDKFALVTSPEQVEANFGKPVISIALGMENGSPLEGKLENVQYFYDRGVRYITLAHGKWNHICDSSYDPDKHWHGLSPFGKKVVREMNRVGIMIDISHVSDETFYQVLELSQAPVIASHSDCRYFTPGWERNMSDEMIRLLAKKGGVIQVAFGSWFIKDEVRKKEEENRKEIDAYLEEHHLKYSDAKAQAFIRAYRKKHPIDPGSVADVADQIDHIVKLVGVDHVGFGSDFDGVSLVPKGLEDVSHYPDLIAELLRRGYSKKDIRKMAGENLLRVWRQVQKVSSRLQRGEK